MQLHYTEIKDLPPLAWFAEIKDGSVDVLHGAQVEISDTWFVEGAWSGEFSKGGFIHSDWFCGTGGLLCGDRIIFSTPTHVTSGLFMTKSAEAYRVSNSLYFLMQKSGLHLDAQYLKYETDFNSITKGIKKYNPNIHVLDRNERPASVTVYYYRNIEIDNSNQCSVTEKKKVAPFADFEDYQSRLTNDMAAMYHNAQDKKRMHKYGVVTMISKGYDAPCCATIVKKIGGDTALTFTAEGKYAEDSGVEIAKKLGYSNIIERDALAYMMRTDYVETEYIASGELGAQISFSAFDAEYKGNLVFGGDRGDSIWDRRSNHRNDEFHFIDMLSHLGIAERHLWVGYIHVPMPLYGASAWPSLYEIANSTQMAKWQMNNSYDRPIPRRIIELAGIPREAFGIEKRGAGFSYHFDWMRRIVRRMSPVSAADFAKYVHANRKPHPIQCAVFFANTFSVYLNRLGLKRDCTDVEKLSGIPNPMAARYLFPWAGEHILGRYQEILER